VCSIGQRDELVFADLHLRRRILPCAFLAHAHRAVAFAIFGCEGAAARKSRIIASVFMAATVREDSRHPGAAPRVSVTAGAVATDSPFFPEISAARSGYSSV